MKKLVLLLSLLMFGCGGETFRLPNISSIFKGPEPESINWNKIYLPKYPNTTYVTKTDLQNCSNCWLYSAISLYESMFIIDHGYQVNLSEQNVMNVLDWPCSKGGNPITALEYLRRVGNVEQSLVRNNDWKSKYLYSNAPKNTKIYLLKQYITILTDKLNSSNKKRLMVELLKNGPVLTDISIYTKDVIELGLPSEDSQYFNIKCNIGKLKQNGQAHAVVVFGYLDDGRFFLIKDSNLPFFVKISASDLDRCNYGNLMITIPRNSTYFSIKK